VSAVSNNQVCGWAGGRGGGVTCFVSLSICELRNNVLPTGNGSLLMVQNTTPGHMLNCHLGVFHVLAALRHMGVHGFRPRCAVLRCAMLRGTMLGKGALCHAVLTPRSDSRFCLCAAS
jgi:hypothetical protein